MDGLKNRLIDFYKIGIFAFKINVLKIIVCAISIVLCLGSHSWKFTTNINSNLEISKKCCCLIKNQYPVNALELISFFTAIRLDFVLSKKVNLKVLHEKFLNFFRPVNHTIQILKSAKSKYYFGMCVSCKKLSGLYCILRI
jgi:hypothetical protein